MAKSTVIDYTKGKILGPCIAMTIPMFIANLLQALYNAADVAVVGKFVGDSALAAVGSAGYIANILNGVMLGFGTAVSIICSVAFGAENIEKVRRTTHTAITFSWVIGAVMAIIGFFFSRRFLIMISTPEEVLDQAELYLKIYFAGGPLSAGYQYAFNIFKSVGNTRRPLIILGISGILNVVLNVVCVVGFNMGVEGVAIGTVSSQLFSVVMSYIILAREESIIHIDFRHLLFDFKIIKELFFVGLPLALNTSAYSVSNAIISNSINACGKIVVAGNSVANNIDRVCDCWNGAVSVALLSIIGQNVGAKKYDRVKATFKNGLLVMTFGAVVFGMFMSIPVFSKPVLRIFTDSEEVIKAAQVKVFFIAGMNFIYGISGVASSALRGMGYSNIPTICNYLCICVPRILWIMCVYRFFVGNIYVLYMCYPISWLFSSATLYLLYKVKLKERMRQNPQPVGNICLTEA